MEIEQVVTLFDKIKFFSEFTAEEKKVVAGLKSNIQKFQPNEWIIKQGGGGFFCLYTFEGKCVNNKE